MKSLKLLLLFGILLSVTSCVSIQTYADFDKNIDFSLYKSFAFHKTGIDKVQVSELDKKRIMQAIETEMIKKGFVKSDSPDFLINFLTKEREQVTMNQFNAGWGYGWGWGWNPNFWGGGNFINSATQGTLIIDVIDAKKNELLWEGEGIGVITENRAKKEAQINEFVTKILLQYPPNNNK